MSRPDKNSQALGDRVILGAIAGAHGIRGQVRIKSFTEVAEDVAGYGPLSNEAGDRTFKLKITGQAKGVLLAKLDGVTDRNQAEALKGTALYIERSKLPDPQEDEYYHADLIGLRGETTSGEVIGEVIGIYDFGAGDLLDLKMEGGRTVMLPFNAEVAVEVDLEAGRIVLDPPDGALDRPDPKDREDEER